jgi:hypothetical protein
MASDRTRYTRVDFETDDETRHAVACYGGNRHGERVRATRKELTSHYREYGYSVDSDMMEEHDRCAACHPENQ